MVSALLQSASQNTIPPPTVSGKPASLLGRQSGEAGAGVARAAGAAGATGAGSRSASVSLPTTFVMPASSTGSAALPTTPAHRAGLSYQPGPAILPASADAATTSGLARYALASTEPIH